MTYPPKYTSISGCIQRNYRGTVLLLHARESTPRPHALQTHNYREYTQRNMTSLKRGRWTALCEGRQCDLDTEPETLTILYSTESQSTS